MNIAIYVYDHAEVLDFSGPFEVFSTANRLSSGAAPFNVFLVAQRKVPVLARGGYSVNPHYGLGAHPDIDLLLIAGGYHDAQVKTPEVIAWVASVAEKAECVTSVCTGAFILAEAGLLAGCEATTHWEDISALASDYPDVVVVESQRWVDSGRVVTSAGISAGIDMSLHLVSRFVGAELAEITARKMDYKWVKSD